MSFVVKSQTGNVTTLTLLRGKVNAVNGEVISELREAFAGLEQDNNCRAVVLTGAGKFFSFGFDIPHFMDYSEEKFAEFLRQFTDFYKYLYSYPKPVVASINGHAIAGGCILALACDYRTMVTGKAKIALNEVTFGSAIFAGCTEMLVNLVGQRFAEQILLTGQMYSAEAAERIGLVDEVVDEDKLNEATSKKGEELAAIDSVAYTGLKKLLRQSVIARIERLEQDSIRDFIEIWYSPSTRAQLQKVKIHD